MALSFGPPIRLSFSRPACCSRLPRRTFAASSENQISHSSIHTRELILEVKGKLERDHPSLPKGKNGRDDEDMILWFLKDRKFSVEEAVAKLTKAIKWREDFGVSMLSEDSVKSLYNTGKAYVHDFLDVNGRPVLVVVASKHFPENQDANENERLCVYLIEKALSKCPPGTVGILGIFDLRGFSTGNSDFFFLKFLIDVFYYYYPKRLGQVLFVDAPFVFQPLWQLVRPLLQSYASLVRFCDAKTVREEYFTEDTVPSAFKAFIPLDEFDDPGITKRYGVKPDSATISTLHQVAKQKEIEVVVKIYWGDAGVKICEAVEKVPIQCLVIGSRGLGKVKRAILGSVSSYVVHHATCPVTVVKN